MSNPATVQAAPAFYKIYVQDLAASIAFYQDCLGFSEKRRMDAGEFDEVIMAPGKTGASLILCRWKDGRAIELGNGHGPTGFFVRDVDQLHADMVARGAKPLLGPADVASMRIAVVADPDGHSIEILQMTNAA